MATFILTAPAFIDGEHIPASVQHPVRRVIPDSVDDEFLHQHVSRSWKPADNAAIKLLRRLAAYVTAHKAKVKAAEAAGFLIPDEPADDVTTTAVASDEGVTMADLTKRQQEAQKRALQGKVGEDDQVAKPATKGGKNSKPAAKGAQAEGAGDDDQPSGDQKPAEGEPKAGPTKTFVQE